MKAKLFIIGLFLFALAACVKVPEPAVAEHGRSVEGPSPELCAIDSLLWHQPDSALACLLPYFDTCIDAKFYVSTATAYNRHYAHLLLSELLYKNDYPQTNRTEMLQAVGYFDSLMVLADTRGVSRQPRIGRTARRTSTQHIAFLDARAHYINGVGYYENDSVVEACAEYLKTLEVMEEHFEDKDLVGHKARFMAYTYNRLGDMFSEQFMMEPAIDCYQNALVFCKIEPTSPQGISNILYRLGKQYDKMGEKTKASDYYEQAIHGLPNNNSLLFRDLVSTKALCDYQLGRGYEQSLNTLKQIQTQANSEIEYLLRSLTIGGIFFKKMMFDSALFYLVPVYENKENVTIQIQAADYLRIIYDSLDNKEKSDECVRFLANQTKAESQNKALVSRLEDQYQSFMNQQQQKQAKEEREKAIKKVMSIIIPIAILVALVIFVLAKLRGKKQLRDKEEHHQREMESERQAHKMQQAALSGRLKRSNEELRELKGQLGQREDATATAEQAASFTDEPICRLIMERVNEGQFKSKVDYVYYKDYALDKQQLLDLRLAADRHFGQFTVRLKKAYPELTNSDLDYCCLYLLGLTDADIAALMQRAYNTVIERNGKLKKVFGKENTLSVTLKAIANGFTSV